jgi:UDP-N-acetylglucosamine--N-acetylmuramyl-(pentapeptide) pyrophosphoryl-undecaprenol N-acetylglucosamine transferase
MGQYKFILSGGGTGHIYPAIAIAYELKFRFPELNFVCQMEMQKTTPVSN